MDVQSLCGRTTISGLLSFKRLHVNPFLGLSFIPDSNGATSHQYLFKCTQKHTTDPQIIHTAAYSALALGFNFVFFTFHRCKRGQSEGETNTWLRVTNQYPVFTNKRRTIFSGFCRIHRKAENNPHSDLTWKLI